MPAQRPVEVAAGVVIRADGAVLLGQRPAGKPYAGWWEFPGGKLEAGETVAQALARELDEELGLEVRASCPWVVREFVYPHAHVRLHFRRVFDFAGEPLPREGQAFAWCRPESIGVAPLLPATVPVIAWLRLPAACERWSPDGAHALPGAPATGARRLFVLHEPAMAAAEFERAFYRARAACRAAGARLLVSSAHAESFARAADGVVLAGDSLRACERRPPGRLAAAFCADARDVERAERLSLDFAIVPGRAPGSRRAGGVVALPGYARDASLPVYLAAEGGEDAAHAARLAGAQGLAPGYPSASADPGPARGRSGGAASGSAESSSGEPATT